MAKKGGKISSGGKFKTGSSYQSKNVQTGLEAERKVLDAIPAALEAERVTKGKTSPDGGIPDIRIYSANNQRLIEVKSIAKNTSDGHGRAQFLRGEIKDLSDFDGLVIFEVRDRGSKRYYKAEAKEVYNLLKDEQGDELKLEYSEITSFEKVDLGDLSIWME